MYCFQSEIKMICVKESQLKSSPEFSVEQLKQLLNFSTTIRKEEGLQDAQFKPFLKTHKWNLTMVHTTMKLSICLSPF